MISFFKKILRGYVIIILFYFVAVVLIIDNFFKKQFLQIYISNLKNICFSMSLPITEFLISKNDAKLDEFIKNLRETLQIRTTIVSCDGVVLFDSHHEKTKMENYSSSIEIIDAKEKGFGYSVRYCSTLRKEMLYVAVPLRDNKEDILAILRTGYAMDNLKININRFIHRILMITIFLCILVLFLSIFLSLSFTKPINKLIGGIQKIMSGDLNTEITIDASNEFSFLVESFNKMVKKINTLLSEVSLQRDKLKNIFNSLQEAVVLIDKDGKIILYNRSFEKLCRISPNNEKFYWEVLVSYKFDEIIKKAFSEKKNLVEEIEIENKTYLVSCSNVSEKEIIVLLYDITSYKQLQNVKKEFISDVVHELKTPLTSIKGFLETLYEEEKNLQYKRFIEIAIFNTNRLINIVNDLVTLSYLEKIEEKKDLVEFEEVDLLSILESVKNIFETKIKQKKLDFIIEIKTDLKPIKADRFKLEQVLVNLIDNAVRYTEKGYIKIIVEQNQTETKIVVEDTGVGIPKEYHERIFERFFVVDKARSKKTGGTGLGLAIVKHIINLHRGKVFVESSPNLGSKFFVLLPNNPFLS